MGLVVQEIFVGSSLNGTGSWGRRLTGTFRETFGRDISCQIERGWDKTAIKCLLHQPRWQTCQHYESLPEEQFAE